MGDLARDMRSMLRRLRPHEAAGHAKIRLGSPHDGGYVLLDDFAGLEAVIGCGVGTNVDFERDFARRDVPVDLFDHTVDAAPHPHPRFTFHRVKVSGEPELEVPSIDLAGIARLRRLKPHAAVLKLDIEGDEWPLLRYAPREALQPYRQIVAEMHWLERAQDLEWRETAMAAIDNLTRDFALVHVHANNHAPMVSLDGVSVPSVLEVSLASRACYALRPSGEEFPTALDRPNHSRTPDHVLGTFDFDDRESALAASGGITTEEP